MDCGQHTDRHFHLCFLVDTEYVMYMVPCVCTHFDSFVGPKVTLVQRRLSL